MRLVLDRDEARHKYSDPANRPVRRIVTFKTEKNPHILTFAES